MFGKKKKKKKEKKEEHETTTTRKAKFKSAKIFQHRDVQLGKLLKFFLKSDVTYTILFS